MSEPSAATAMSAATAAADPPEEPPGTRVRSRGLCTGFQAEFSFDEPMANSSQFSFAQDYGARPLSSRATAVQS